MEFVEETGYNVENALKKALKKLNLSISEVKYVIIKKEPVVIRVYKKTKEIEEIENLLKEFIDILGTVGSIQIIPEANNTLYINIKTKDLDDVLIGKDGKTLEKLDYLLNYIIKRKFRLKYKFIFDISGYRKRRENYIINKAIATAKLAIENKLEYTLDPLKKQEEKVVLDVLSKVEGIKVEKIGKGKNTRIVIVPDVK